MKHDIVRYDIVTLMTPYPSRMVDKYREVYMADDDSWRELNFWNEEYAYDIVRHDPCYCEETDDD